MQKVVTVEGYDIVAQVQRVHGGGDPNEQEWLILNNNHNTYLLGCREPGDERMHVAQSRHYSGEDGSAELAYSTLLDLLMYYVRRR